MNQRVKRQSVWSKPDAPQRKSGQTPKVEEKVQMFTLTTFIQHTAGRSCQCNENTQGSKKPYLLEREKLSVPKCSSPDHLHRKSQGIYPQKKNP